VQRLRPELWRQNTRCLITTTHRLALPFSPLKFFFYQRRHYCHPQPTHPTFLFFPIQDKTESPPFWHNSGNRDRIAGGAEHPNRTRPPRSI
jgi:hypothetical protein